MQRFEITVTERELAPVDHPAASKCKCKCLDGSGGPVSFTPDVQGADDGVPSGQASLSPLAD
jgi:hypothetical protein